MKNFYFAAYKSGLDISVFKTIEERNNWLKGKDIIPAGDPILAEEREALTLDDVRTTFYPRTDAEITDYIRENAKPDDILDNVKWINF